jgi:hypothetical protein
LRTFFLLLLSLLSVAFGLTINFEADRLERRVVTLPDGTSGEIIVLSGQPARLEFEGNVIEATLIEFDPNHNLLRIIGPGYYATAEAVTTGEDFVVDLNDERFQARQVVLVTAAIDIEGVEVTRLPGQIDVVSGVFSPCARCAQRVEDYSFSAESLRLYPGDRIVAYGVTVFVRGAALFRLPVMVYPLGPQERRPRFATIQGTATERAEVALDWPYTAGANAFGLVSLRYYADVDPEAGDPFSRAILGGAATTHYFGGGVWHRYFGEDAEGELEFGFRPYFRGLGTAEDERERFLLRWRHTTYEELEGPRIGILFERDDARRQRLSEYSLTAERALAGFNLRFFTQGYIDHEPGLGLRLPAYAGFNVPERTFGQVGASSLPGFGLSAGPFVLNTLAVDLGVFEDRTNPLNRRALALGPRIRGGRFLHESELRLNPITPWAGLSIDGLNAFLGQYYTTGERLVRWNSRINLSQSFGAFGNLNVTFLRTTTEGETPFSFDVLTPASRTELATALSLRPLPWLSLDARQLYVFLDTRRPDVVGPGPLETTLSLFGNVPWLNLTLRNVYDFQEGDPGELRADLALALDPFRLEVNHVQDLDPRPVTRLPGEPVETTRTVARFDFALRPYLHLEARGGYRYAPTEPAADGALEHWEPLRLALTLGALEPFDDLPGARVVYERDLDRGETRLLGLEATASYHPFEVSLRQEMNIGQGQLAASRYLLAWREVMELEAAGFAVLPMEWFGLVPDPAAAQNWVVQLRDLSPFRQEAWRLRYSTTLDPALIGPGGEVGGFRNSRLDAFVNIQEGEIGPLVFGLDFSAGFLLADLALPVSYLQSANLTLRAQLAERVGVQGAFGYRGLFQAGEFTASALTLTDVALTVRVLDELYLSAIFNDTWDFTGRIPQQSPFNLQPRFYVVWDRCCWAFYGSWDSRTGRVSLGIAAPGGETGLQQEFETDLLLPGRE